MDPKTQEFLKYLEAAATKVGDYFNSEAWLHCQVNMDILMSFILNSCRMIPYYDFADDDPHERERELLLSRAEQLGRAVARIHGRTRPGQNDSAHCHAARSAMRAFLSGIPDHWLGHIPDIPIEVRNIIDKDSFYTRTETQPDV